MRKVLLILSPIITAAVFSDHENISGFEEGFAQFLPLSGCRKSTERMNCRFDPDPTR
jgi:hypothetical protein